MIALWSMPKPEFSGQWVKFKGVNAMPRPVQNPHPEVVFGGHTKETYSRVARLAKGWYGFALDLDGTQKCINGLREACKAEGRKFEDIEISLAPSGKVDRDTAKRSADLGVHRLILLPGANDEASILSGNLNGHDEASILFGKDEASILKMISETNSDLIGKVLRGAQVFVTEYLCQIATACCLQMGQRAVRLDSYPC